MAFESFVRPFSNVIETDLGLGMAVLESLAATFAHGARARPFSLCGFLCEVLLSDYLVGFAFLFGRSFAIFLFLFFFI